VSAVWQVTVGPLAGFEALQLDTSIKPVSLASWQLTVWPPPTVAVHVPTFAQPLSVVWQVIVWPPPDDGEQVAASTNPVSEVLQVTV
jgi:hypothetical protein